MYFVYITELVWNLFCNNFSLNGTNNALQKKCFGTINFVKIAQQWLYKANSFACSLVNRGKLVAATLQRKCSDEEILVIITKFITKKMFQGIIL